MNRPARHPLAPPNATDACIVGVVGVLEREGNLLIIQRSHLVRAGGMWCFPGGEVEHGEQPAEAIEREMAEEVGLRVRARDCLWTWLRDDGGLYLEWWELDYVGGELVPNPAEVAQAVYVTDAEMRALDGLIAHNLTFLDHYRRRNH